jgi:hypothetical protein
MHPPVSWSSQWSTSSGFLPKSYTHIQSSSTHTHYIPMSIPLDLIILITWRRVQIMKLLIMQISLTTRHFISLRPKNSSPRLLLKHPKSTFFPHCQKPSFTPIQKHRQNYSFLYSNFVFRESRREDKRLWTEW